MSRIEEKLKELADNAYKEKVKSEKKAIEQRYLKDKTLLSDILEVVKKGLVYKEVGDTWNRKYVVVTEEILFDDYTTPAKNSWSSGTEMKSDGRHLTIKVNGNLYKHLGGLLEDYKEKIEKSIELNQYERDRLYDKRNLIENLEKQERHIKNMLEEYQASIQANEEEEL